jgi:hypothetical protein
MSEVSVQVETPEGVISTVLEHLRSGQIVEATSRFAEVFRFMDYGIGVEFTDKARLAEFFYTVRRLYPDSLVSADEVFNSGNHVAVKWMWQATITEPFFGQLSRRTPISVHGVSIVRMNNGEIVEWSDYYDGVTSRRTALASHYEDWVEL